MPETHTCRLTGRPFEITETDLGFYKKIGVPPPTLCPEERERRRLVWRNERHLYRRNCGLCKKSMIAIYPEECSFPVYCEKCFWSDEWDPLNYGKDFDFNRGFFEQLTELQNVVPRLAITNTRSQNSEYTLNSLDNKNCYMTSGADYNEDCMYGINTQRSKDCADHYLIYESSLCYGCLDSIHLYNCVGCQECEECTDCWFLFDSKGCRNCAFSNNLRNKEYVLFNKQLTREEYMAQFGEILKTLFDDADWMDKNRRAVREKAIHRAARIIHSENVLGNNIKNSKNTYHAFDVEELEECKFAHYNLVVKFGYDISAVGFKCNWCYEIMSAAYIHSCFFSNAIFLCNNLQYCIGCWNSSDLFGCISVRNHKEYCILNKQYPEEEYRKLVPRIIEHMGAKGEYGEYFPAGMSPYEYNRSAANDYMPLDKESATKLGFKWHEESVDATPSPTKTAGDSVGMEIFRCAGCGNNYRVIEQELKIYRKIKVPPPKFCWPCRLKKLIGSRKPRKLFQNTCGKCGKTVQTPTAPGRPETIYCEKCYLGAVY